MTNKTYKNKNTRLIPPHGGYRKLQSYQMAEIIYDATVAFCDRYKSYLTYKTYEQMTGAARSGKQNIAEGSMVSGTSKKSELKLVGVARGSLEELLLDYQDLLRQQNLGLWAKNHPQARAVRQLAYQGDRSYMTYKTYVESGDVELAANTMVCIIHQANYLLDQQLRTLEKTFLEEGGFTERAYRLRTQYRSRG